jgi:hypothetical protein
MAIAIFIIVIAAIFIPGGILLGAAIGIGVAYLICGSLFEGIAIVLMNDRELQAMANVSLHEETQETTESILENREQ